MRQALTVALQDFEGAIVLISHDRHLLANTVDAFLLVADAVVKNFDGDLNDYRERLLAAAPRESRPPEAAKAPVKNNFRASQQLNTRLKTLETRLERLQRKLAETESLLGDPGLYEEAAAARLQGLLRDQIGLKEQIGKLEELWFATGEALDALAAC
jgi:ATP-binding cassette subfamily F protein 3